MPTPLTHSTTNDIQKLELVFDAANEGFFYMTSDGATRFFNKGFYSKFDLNLENSSLENWAQIVHPDDRDAFNDGVVSHLKNQTDSVLAQYRTINKQGKIVWIESLGRYIYNEQDRTAAIVGYHADITERKLEEERIKKLAFHDPLTGLFNRNYAHAFLESLMADGDSGYLIYIDIHHFKNINMTFGYETGDAFLCMIAERLKSVLPSYACIARHYVDEFIVIVPTSESNEIESLIQLIHDDISSSFFIQNTPIMIKSHICIYPIIPAHYTVHPVTPDQILHKTHVVVSHMKSNQQVGIQHYNHEIETRYTRQLEIEHHLPWALANKEMYVQFQPVVDNKTGKLKGFETLLRWKNPVLGIVGPDEFIPVAEKNTFINAIGDFVLKSACEFIKQLTAIGGKQSVSVNLSLVQLYQPDYVERTLNIIKDAQVATDRLVLEVTESVTLDKSEYLEKLHFLHKQGIQLAIDDFGTGYSSLNAIIALPVSYLKIDRSLISDLLTSAATTTLIEMVTAYSKRVNYSIIAEGVETEALRAKLIELNVPLSQGYLFSRPLDSIDALNFVTKKPIESSSSD